MLQSLSLLSLVGIYLLLFFLLLYLCCIAIFCGLLLLSLIFSYAVAVSVFVDVVAVFMLKGVTVGLFVHSRFCLVFLTTAT